ncbi:MAG: M56 family metallopeptidase [Lachnospiraceae bacterium]|nr:M56 family metallopeptidase [Lachnospiraceae bacterium]
MTLLKMSIYGAVIILAIVLIRALTLHKLPKKIFVILWSIALLRLLVPFEISSSYSIYSLLPKQQTNTYELQVTEPSEHNTYFPAEESEFALPPVSDMPSMAGTELPPAPANTVTSAGSTALRQLLPVLWTIGTALCALYFCVSYLKCYREFSTSLPVKEPFAAEWLNTHPLRRTISIRQSDRIETPLTYGIFRPVILLPKTMDWQNRQQTDYILYHEFTHIRRFDQATKLLLIAALCLHWFNPFVWVMYYFFNRDIELSCDECVLKHNKEARSAYAMTLIHMEENRTHMAPLFSHFGENAIEERITAIMKMQKVTFGISLFSILLVLAVIVTLTTTAKAAEDDPANHPFPSVTTTPTPTPDPGPTATPSPTPNPTPTTTPTPTPNPAPTTTPPPSIYPINGSYAAIVKGCMENVLMLDFVEYDTSTGEVTNPTSPLVHYQVAKDVEIRLINFDAKENNPEDDYIVTDDLSKFISSVYTEYGWSKMPYFFEIKDGFITGIEEKMIP